MKYIYVIHHFNPKNYDEKYIGAYHSYKEAEEVVAQCKNFKGFKDAPDYFYIDEYEIDKLYWTKGYYSVTVKNKPAKS